VEGSCKYGDDPSGSGATELVRTLRSLTISYTVVKEAFGKKV
jgi:hypothetical protein